jgi:ATP-binding cassette, subfamily B, bacterial
LATIQKADRIVVLQKGRIVETGKHDELVAKAGVYAKLAALQFGHESWGRLRKRKKSYAKPIAAVVAA